MGIFDQMKQAMQMRSEMKRIQSEVEKITANYANGGISVTVRGDFTVQSIKIEPDTWAEVQKGKTDRFETMLLNVINGAIKTAKKTTQEHMAQMMQAAGRKKRAYCVISNSCECISGEAPADDCLYPTTAPPQMQANRARAAPRSDCRQSLFLSS